LPKEGEGRKIKYKVLEKNKLLIVQADNQIHKLTQVREVKLIQNKIIKLVKNLMCKVEYKKYIE
jgi:hypothetical protein